MRALVEDTARGTVEVMVMATVVAIITVTTVDTAIAANMEIPVRMVDMVVAATAPVGTKKQFTAANRNIFVRSLSHSFRGEGSSFLYPESVFFIHQLDDLRDGVSFHQFIPNKTFLLHCSLGHVALALSQGQFTTAAAGALEVHRYLTNLVLNRVCC